MARCGESKTAFQLDQRSNPESMADGSAHGAEGDMCGLASIVQHKSVLEDAPSRDLLQPSRRFASIPVRRNEGRAEALRRGMDTRMRTNIKLILLVSLVAFICEATAHVRAQSSSSSPKDIGAVKPSSIPVCENGDVNAQVKAALRLVCAERGSDESPVSGQELIIIGFLGGFAKSGDTKHPEVWFGAYLRELYPSAAEVSVISNHQWRRAMKDVLQLLDTDQNGVLTAAEKRQAKIIVYGHSWGASEAATFARELDRLGIPVLLTIQIDIVPKPGQRPILIPPNVEAAVNFFQSEGEGLLHGRPEVVAEDPGRTEIIGNVHMTYGDQHVDCRNYPWFARTFNKPHHQIENDARVWKQVAFVIDSRLSSLKSPMEQAAMH